MPTQHLTRGPLDGVVVADFGRVLAGPYCSMLLADLGAWVVKVESPSGDDTRSWMPPTRGGRSTYFESINRNKLSIALDLTRDDDRATARRIAIASDVLIENLMPGKMDSFGLGYDDLRGERPSLVYASISGFGEYAGAGLPGYDLLVQAMSGLMSLTGSPEGPAYRAGFGVFDVIAGLHLGIATLAALRHATATGEGQHVRTDLLSAALSSMANQTGSVVLANVTPRRLGNAHPSIAPYEPFATALGDIVIAVGNNRQFKRLCTLVGAPDLVDDPRAAGAAARVINREYVHDRLATLLAHRSANEWLVLFQAGGVPAAVVNDLADALRLADRLGLGPVSQVEGEPTVSNPIRMSRTPVEYRRRPPELDADRLQILDWLAG